MKTMSAIFLHTTLAPISYQEHVLQLLQAATAKASWLSLHQASWHPWKPLWWQQMAWKKRVARASDTVLFNATGKKVAWPGPVVDCATDQWQLSLGKQQILLGHFPPFALPTQAPAISEAIHSFFAAYAGENLDYITQLLKAFSQFVQWQKSAMHLHLLVVQEKPRRQLMDLLATYKFRKQVKLLKDPADLLFGAYAYLHWAPPGQADALLNTAVSEQLAVATLPSFDQHLPGLRTGPDAAKLMTALYREEADLPAQTLALHQAQQAWPSPQAQQQWLMQAFEHLRAGRAFAPIDQVLPLL